MFDLRLCVVGRGGVEPPTFHFSGRAFPQVNEGQYRCVPAVCPTAASHLFSIAWASLQGLRRSRSAGRSLEFPLVFTQVSLSPRNPLVRVVG